MVIFRSSTATTTRRYGLSSRRSSREERTDSKSTPREPVSNGSTTRRPSTASSAITTCRRPGTPFSHGSRRRRRSNSPIGFGRSRGTFATPVNADTVLLRRFELGRCALGPDRHITEWRRRHPHERRLL